MKLGVDLAGGERLGARGEIVINRREVRKAQAEHAENVVGVLHHAARAHAHRDASAAQIGDRPNRGIGARDEEQRPGIHRGRHADVDRLRERRLTVLGAADPVRGHEAEFDVACVQAIGVLDTRRTRFQDRHGLQHRMPVKNHLERLALAMKRAVALRGTDASCH